MKEMKKEILKQLKSTQAEEVKKIKDAYKSTHAHATETELKAEGKYDTRSIEAGYLAGAQLKRVEQAEQELALLEEIDLDHSSETICVGSLVEIQYEEILRKYFISSTSGGTMLKLDGEVILVISAFSPLGAEAIGLSEGDEFEVGVGEKLRTYKIRKVV